MSFHTCFLVLLIFLSLATIALFHGLMAVPNQRGTLAHFQFNMNAPEINQNAEQDFFPHFPAGDKSSTPGFGKKSQEIAAGPAGWKTFEPLITNFKWRAGVCGDVFGKPEHLKGGRYYNNGQIVANYTQGGKVALILNIVAHHNGFIQLHLCEVQKCGGEISEDCFRNKHCVALNRSANPICDSGMSKECAPIDPNHPGRFYLPCTKFGIHEGVDVYGEDNTILYDLPEHLACEHCVLQWFWSTANACNPPGVIDFFDSPHAPKNWGNCPGQAGAIGGVSRVQRSCGLGDDGVMRFPEEYLQCADIAIKPVTGAQQMMKRPLDMANPMSVPSMDPTGIPTPSLLPTMTPSIAPTTTPSIVPAMTPSVQMTSMGASVGSVQDQEPEPVPTDEIMLLEKLGFSMEPSPEESLEDLAENSEELPFEFDDMQIASDGAFVIEAKSLE